MIKMHVGTTDRVNKEWHPKLDEKMKQVIAYCSDLF